MINTDDQFEARSTSERTEATPPSSSRASQAERWVREHGDLLWRFALSRTRSREIAEEVLQETILAAMQAADQFTGASSERTWLLGIAAHKLADYFRRERRRTRAGAGGADDRLENHSDESAAAFGRAGQWAILPARWGDRPDDAVERVELLAALRHCVESLPPELAEAVWLRDLFGMESAEVCKVLGLSPTNLWTRTHRARSALRLCVEKAMGMRRENPR